MAPASAQPMTPNVTARPPDPQQHSGATLLLPPGSRPVTCPSCQQTFVLIKEPTWSESVRCNLCRGVVPSRKDDPMLRWTIMFVAAAALCMLPRALTQPLVSIKRPGGIIESGFADGVMKLWELDAKFIAVVVALCSGLLPVTKCVMLILVGLFPNMRHSHRRFVSWWVNKTASLSFIDAILVVILLLPYAGMLFVQITIEPGFNLFVFMAACLLFAGTLSKHSH